MSNTTLVSAAEIRDWATKKSNLRRIPEAGHKCLTAPVIRGRLHPTVIETFEKYNEGKAYGEKVAVPQEPIKVKVPHVQPSGKKGHRVVEVTPQEVRSFLGQPAGIRGRLPKAGVLAAAEAKLNA